jgi:hypothetical protein
VIPAASSLVGASSGSPALVGEANRVRSAIEHGADLGAFGSQHAALGRAFAARVGDELAVVLAYDQPVTQDQTERTRLVIGPASGWNQDSPTLGLSGMALLDGHLAVRYVPLATLARIGGDLAFYAQAPGPGYLNRDGKASANFEMPAKLLEATPAQKSQAPANIGKLSTVAATVARLGSAQASAKRIDYSEVISSHVFAEHEHFACGMGISPGGRTLVGGAGDGRLQIIDLDKLEVAHSLKPQACVAEAAAVSPDGKLAAFGNYAGVVRLVDCSSGEVKTEMKTDLDNIKSLVFSPSGEHLAAAGGNYHVNLWRLKDGKLQDLKQPNGRKDTDHGWLRSENLPMERRGRKPARGPDHSRSQQLHHREAASGWQISAHRAAGPNPGHRRSRHWGDSGPTVQRPRAYDLCGGGDHRWPGRRVDRSMGRAHPVVNSRPQRDRSHPWRRFRKPACL